MICSIEGCTRPHRARGWCNQHYQRWYKWGDPIIPAHTPGPDCGEAWHYRGSYNGCWEWTGSVINKDDIWGQYGRVFYEGKGQLVHRLAYEAVNGPIPENLEVCHHCDNTLCWRPDHLFLGTRKENVQDAVKKGRIAHKLSEEEVKAIKQAVTSGETQSTVARRFNVSQSHVRDILNGRRRSLVFTGGEYNRN